jgi:hypothetical protein
MATLKNLTVYDTWAHSTQIFITRKSLLENTEWADRFFTWIRQLQHVIMRVLAVYYWYVRIQDSYSIFHDTGLRNCAEFKLMHVICALDRRLRA